jgi:hypothetical protein
MVYKYQVYKHHYIFGGKNDEENKRVLELFMEINNVCDDEDWHIVMITIANLMQAGFDLAPENADARNMFETIVSEIRKRVWE